MLLQKNRIKYSENTIRDRLTKLSYNKYLSDCLKKKLRSLIPMLSDLENNENLVAILSFLNEINNDFKKDCDSLEEAGLLVGITNLPDRVKVKQNVIILLFTFLAKFSPIFPSSQIDWLINFAKTICFQQSLKFDKIKLLCINMLGENGRVLQDTKKDDIVEILNYFLRFQDRQESSELAIHASNAVIRILTLHKDVDSLKNWLNTILFPFLGSGSFSALSIVQTLEGISNQYQPFSKILFESVDLGDINYDNFNELILECFIDKLYEKNWEVNRMIAYLFSHPQQSSLPILDLSKLQIEKIINRIFEFLSNINVDEAIDETCMSELLQGIIFIFSNNKIDDICPLIADKFIQSINKATNEVLLQVLTGTAERNFVALVPFISTLNFAKEEFLIKLLSHLANARIEDAHLNIYFLLEQCRSNPLFKDETNIDWHILEIYKEQLNRRTEESIQDYLITQTNEHIELIQKLEQPSSDLDMIYQTLTQTSHPEQAIEVYHTSFDKLFSKDRKRTTSEIAFLCKVYLDINVESVRYRVMEDLCHMIFLLYKYPGLISIESIRALSCLREQEKYSEIIDQVIDFLNYAVLQNSNFFNNHEEITDILVKISIRNMDAVYLRNFFQAKRLIDNNEYPLEAWEYLETAENQFDHYAPIYYYQGLYQVNKQELSSAIKLFEMALSMRPVYVEAAQKLSVAYYKMGDWYSARIVNQKISELYPAYRTLTRSQISGIVESSVPLAQIPMLNVFDKAYQVIASTADADLNTDTICQMIRLLNTPALSADNLLFCRESYQLDEGFAALRHNQEKRRFLNDFLSYVLDKCVWFEYHQHYAVNRERDAVHNNFDKLIDASKITDIFEVDNVQCLKQQLQQYCQLFNMDNFLQRYAGTTQLRGGYALGISKDLAQTYSVFHNILGLYHYEAAYGISNARGEDDLFNFVLHQQKPVVFFIPTAIGAGKKDGFTYREINWIAQKLKTNPAELKNLILVFDSYNYLPLYSLMTLVDSKWIINADCSINAVLDFLLEYVIAPDDAAERMPILRSNIENHVHINIYGYMLYVLNSAIEYDPEFNDTSFVDILKLLLERIFKINIGENINPQTRLQEFYLSVEAQLNMLKENPNKQNKQKLGVILRFLTELFANNFYANYINPENRYIDIESRLYVLTEQYDTLSPDFESWKKSRDERWAILQAASKNAYRSSLDIIFTKLKDFNEQGFFDINEELLTDYLIPDDVQRSKRALKRIKDYQYAKKNRKPHDTYGELGNNWTHHETLADGNCALSAFALGLLYHRNNGNDLLTTKPSFRRKFAQSFYLNPDAFTEEAFSQVVDALLSPQIDLDNPIIKKIIKKLSNVKNVVEGTESNQINTKIEAANQRIFKPEIFENGNIRPEYRDGAIKCLARQGILYQLAMAYALREYCFSYNQRHFRCFTDRILEEPQERDLTVNITNQFGEYLTEDIFAFLAYKFNLKIQLKTQEFGKIYNYGNGQLEIMIFALKPGEVDCHFELVLPAKKNFLEGKLAMLRVINYPALLSQFGIKTKVRMNKVTGPRVKGAIEEIRKKIGNDKALEIEAKFCHWAKEHNRNFNFKR